MTGVRERAPGKVNLCLYLGPRRDDGLHELVSLVQAVSIADDVSLEPAPGGARGDEVHCPGVDGPNLAAAALAACRRVGWDAPAQRVAIAKRIPVAAGMGGGSSDAAATLRLAVRAGAPLAGSALEAAAFALGADVPALLEPGLALVTGAGEDVRRLPALDPFWLVVVPSAKRLATAAVFAEADRLRGARSDAELAERRAAVEAAVAAGGPVPLALAHNDLQPAARSLCPAIDAPLQALVDAGAARALVSGSGPTVFGIFTAEDAAHSAAAAVPGAQVAAPFAAKDSA